ncbi:MAG: polyprenol monophosphomannose synthase [Bifidobacteriaceae bacterium]|jgi:glycosyltransferase involved in cell wall biosynthesis|nr:polyprenol monophosphomannose synthase [Bifidobacteriaceae bacterium]
MPKRTLVVIPTYNEIESLPRVLTRLRQAVPAADVLIVDDDSPDGTGKWADAQAQDDPAIHVMHHGVKAGLGGAYVDGFTWGLGEGYDVLCTMDADGSHRPEQLPSLLKAIDDGADLAIGSRWIRGGEVVNWPKSREFLSRGGNIYIAAVMGLRIRDATAGFRAFRADLLRRVDLSSVDARGFVFTVDMSRRAVAAGANVVEVPISFVEREAGVSKMSSDIFFESLGKVTRWGIRMRLARLHPKRH